MTQFPMRLIHRLMPLFLALLLAPRSGFSQGNGPGQVRPINGPATITEPGAYILNRSLHTALPAAITILADHVSLDLNGETLTGTGGFQSVGVLISGAAQVRVHNGGISGFGVGVQVMSHANNVVLENLQISGRDLGGTPATGIEIGVLIVNSRAVVVRHNTVSRVFLGVFVRGGGSGGNHITGNTLTGANNGALGICYNPSPAAGATDGPSGDLIYNNLISRFGTGLQTSATSLGNVFRENTIAYFTSEVVDHGPAGSNIFDNTGVKILPY